MFEISKEFAFSASHQLTHLRSDHPCARMHGHNYTVKITLRGETDDRGFVYDYRDLDFFKVFVDSTFDHQHLNTVMSNALGLPIHDAARYTTAEHLAQYFYNWLHATNGALPLHSVSVSETPKTWATYGG